MGHSPAIRIIAAAALFSTGGAAIKTAAFSGMQIASLRSGIAAAMLILCVRGRAQWSWRVAPVALTYAATLVLFVISTKLTTAASAIFLQSTAPLYVVMLAPLFLRERFDRRDVLFVATAAAGLLFCFLGQPASTTTAPDPFTGNIVGVACGAAWALTLLGMRWGEQHVAGTSVASVIAGNLLACAAGMSTLYPLPQASPSEWATLAYLGIFQIGVAYILLTGAIGHLPTLQVSLLLLLEPVLNPIWTWLVRDEVPGLWTLAGGTLILAACTGEVVTAARGLAMAIPGDGSEAPLLRAPHRAPLRPPDPR